MRSNKFTKPTAKKQHWYISTKLVIVLGVTVAFLFGIIFVLLARIVTESDNGQLRRAPFPVEDSSNGLKDVQTKSDIFMNQNVILLDDKAVNSIQEYLEPSPIDNQDTMELPGEDYSAISAQDLSQSDTKIITVQDVIEQEETNWSKDVEFEDTNQSIYLGVSALESQSSSLSIVTSSSMDLSSSNQLSTINTSLPQLSRHRMPFISNGATCRGGNDPFKAFPVDSFIPPASSNSASQQQWHRAVLDMKQSVGALKYGGRPLREYIRNEIIKLETLRKELFCSDLELQGIQ